MKKSNLLLKELFGYSFIKRLNPNCSKFISVLVLVLLVSQSAIAQWSATNLSGNINTVFANGTDLLAGTNGGNGAVYTPDNGVNWGAANTGMDQYPDVRAFAADPTYVYAGTTGGVYRSLNNGTYNWTKVLNNVSCFSLLINSSGIYAGTMGGGVYFSADNGTTWTQVNNGISMLYVYALTFNGTYLFAGTYHNGSTPGTGVFRSSDNGQTWIQVNTGLTNNTIMSFAVKGTILFAGTDGGGIFRTTDNGNHWVNVAGGVAHTLKVVCGTDLYAGFLSGGGISRSSDNGNTWTAYSTGLPNTGGYTVMSIDASSTKLFAGTLGGGVAKADKNCTTQSAACISWNLTSSQAVTSTSGNISGQSEIISTGSSAPLMQVYGYNNGQELWVGNTGWVPFPTNTPAEDPLRYLQFNASPTAGNNFTVNSVSFNYGDTPLSTDFNILSFLTYYSTDGWSTRTLLNSSALIYKNTAMNTFSVSGLSVPVTNGQTFSLRIYPYPILHGIAMTPTFAIHNNVSICGTIETVKTGSICGQKFNDLNANGVKDPSETGLANWVITLKTQNAAGWITIKDTTDVNGNYCFNNLQTGTYTVSEINQSGWIQTFPANPGTHTVILTAGQNVTGVDFGNKQAGSPACLTWDLLSSQAVTSTSGNIIGQSETISTGSSAPLMQVYGYNNGQELWVGNTGWVPFPTNTPAEDPLRFLQFNASPTAGNNFTVNSVSFNYGDAPLGTDFNILSFLAYYSTDGWSTRTLLNSSALIYKNTVMNTINVSGLSVPVANGQTFSLRIYPYPILHGIAMTPTFAIHNNLSICGTTEPVKTSSICGQKFNDLNGNSVKDSGETGLSNWIITLKTQNAAGWVILKDTTDVNGNYCFNNLSAGTYTVSEINQNGWLQTFPDYPGTHTVILTEGQNITGIDFGNTANLAKNCISPPSGMVGWWPGDNYSLDISGLNNNGTLIGGATYTNGKVADAFKVATVSDLVTIPDNSSLNFGTGNFSIDAWIQTTDSLSAIAIVDKLIMTGDIWNWTNINILGYGLFIQQGELVFHMGQGAISIDKRVTLNNIADGKWHFAAVTVDRMNAFGGKMFIDGNMVLSFDPTLVPNSINNTRALTLGELIATTNSTSIVTKIDEVEIFNRALQDSEITALFNADAAGKCKLGAICGQKFNDLNGNGVKDSGESGLANWVISIKIQNAAGWVIIKDTTDVNGNYCFNNLQAGTYTISEINQSGWIQTYPANPGTHTVILTAGQNVTGVDFGNTQSSCVKAWTPLTTGTNGEVWALAVIGTDLYVGGNFTTAGGNTANHIAKWNGSAWSPLVSANTSVNGINGMVTALTVIGTDLYAGGWFTDAGGVPSLNVAKWDGSNWTALGSGISAAGAINALVAIGNNIYATTYILDPALGGQSHIIAKWDGSNWSQFTSMDDYVSTFLVDGTNLYAGGQFTMIGTVPANHIAKWDGTNWSALGVGTDFYIGGAGLEMMSGKLYVGGRFLNAGGSTANFIASWDGSAWSSFGSGSNIGMNNEVECVKAMGGDLYASGSFTTAQGISANSIAKWDGTTWSPLGTGMNDGVWRLAVLGSDLYAGGIFTTADNQSANYIAKYSCVNSTAVNNLTMNQQFQLEQNQPNPFRTSTVISYNIPHTSFVKISIYDIFGKEIRVLVNDVIDAGQYKKVFEVNNLPSGIYFCTLNTAGFNQSKKMIVIK